jgi:hypothetical protein
MHTIKAGVVWCGVVCVCLVYVCEATNIDFGEEYMTTVSQTITSSFLEGNFVKCETKHELWSLWSFALLLCSMVKVYWYFRDACCLHHQDSDGGTKHLWNIGKHLPHYMVQQTRRQPPSYSLLEPEISHGFRKRGGVGGRGTRGRMSCPCIWEVAEFEAGKQ